MEHLFDDNDLVTHVVPNSRPEPARRESSEVRTAVRLRWQ
jgi:hypothetical protein